VRKREECDYGNTKAVKAFNKDLYVVCSSFCSSGQLTALSQD
jgi:hypothetical protein